LLERAVLEDGFDDEIGRSERFVLRRATDAIANGTGPISTHDPPVDGLLERSLDGREAARDFLIIHIDQKDVEALGRHFLGDATAHIAGAHDGENTGGPCAVHLNLSTTKERRTWSILGKKSVQSDSSCLLVLRGREFRGRKQYHWRSMS